MLTHFFNIRLIKMYSNVYHNFFYTLIYCWICQLLLPEGTSGDSVYSSAEEAAIEQFRPIVKDVLYKDYMLEDYYMIKWLRARNLDLKKAEDMLRKAHKWRLENKIDSILREDWSDSTYYKNAVTSDGFDLEGRPIVEFDLYYLPSRKLLLSPLVKRYNRYFNWMMENVTTRARETRMNNVTESLYLMDFTSYSHRLHACLQCIPYQVRIITDFEAYYPGTFKDIYFINVPRAFQAFFQTLKPLFSEQTVGNLHLLGHDKSEWQAIILKHVAPEQLSPKFGGTRIRV